MLPNTAPALPGSNNHATPPPLAPALPSVAPTLPSAAVQLTPPPLTPGSPESAETSEPVHPMAHLMPTNQSGPNEASRRAAEKRAIQKAKAKKTKIGVIGGLVVVSALAGPPLARWVIDAINEAGNTTTVVDEPAE